MGFREFNPGPTQDTASTCSGSSTTRRRPCTALRATHSSPAQQQCNTPPCQHQHERRLQQPQRQWCAWHAWWEEPQCKRRLPGVQQQRVGCYCRCHEQQVHFQLQPPQWRQQPLQQQQWQQHLHIHGSIPRPATTAGASRSSRGQLTGPAVQRQWGTQGGPGWWDRGLSRQYQQQQQSRERCCAAGVWQQLCSQQPCR